METVSRAKRAWIDSGNGVSVGIIELMVSAASVEVALVFGGHKERFLIPREPLRRLISDEIIQYSLYVNGSAGLARVDEVMSKQ